MAQSEEKSSLQTMKAIMCTKIGEPKDVLKLMDVPMPAITKPNHVLIKVLYASLNPVDFKMINGMMGIVSPKKPPFVAGRDFCGRVIAKGKGINFRLTPGDMVYGQCWANGSFAEYCICEGQNVHKMPKTITPLQAASIPLVSQTSYQALIQMGLTKKSRLLILGGSTATGLMAIQIAKKFLGCKEVICTSSQEQRCQLLGADRVINYKKDDWTKVLKDSKLDAIYDCVGGIDSWNDSRSKNVLKKDGYYVTICGDENHMKAEDGHQLNVGKLLTTGFSIVNRKFWGAVGQHKYDFLMADSKKNLRDITSLIDAHKLKPVLDEESPFAFDDYMKMFDKCMAAKAKGKLVIHISDDDDNENKEKLPQIDKNEDDKKEEN